MHSRVRLGANERHALADRLEARRSEIEQSTLTRVDAIAGPTRGVGVEYADGLRSAVAAAVDFGLSAVARGDGSVLEIPTQLLFQARLAARHGVELGTVLRRYAAGYTLLVQFLAEEAERSGVPRGGLAQLLSVQAMLFDRVAEAVTEEYGRERVRPASVEQRRVEIVQSLLGGALVDTSNFAYDFDTYHVAAIARGPCASAVTDELVERLGGRRLAVAPDDQTVWAWLGHRQPFNLDALEQRPPALAPETCLAIGEPGHGITGWRHSHQQASAALLIATRSSEALVRYRDVALIASATQDELLIRSLHELYISPLRNSHDGGADTLIETLSAYFAAGRNSASAAAALNVSRQTVDYRLRTIEDRIGRPLSTCMTAVEVSLGLHELRIGSSHWQMAVAGA